MWTLAALLKARWGLGALIIFVSVVDVAAQTTVSEDEAVVKALAGSPDVLALRQGVLATRALESRLATVASPELRVGVSGVLAAIEGDDDQRTNVGLRWAPPMPGKMSISYASAHARAKEAESDVRSAENRLAAEVRLLHRTVRLIDEQIRIAREAVETQGQLLAVVNEQTEARVKTVLDGSRAELGLAVAKADEARLAAERRVHLVRLCHKTGVAYSETLVLTGGPDLLTPHALRIDAAEVRRQALDGRPELAAAASKGRLAELTVRTARRERLPWFSFVQVTKLNQAGPGARWGFNVGIDTGLFRWHSGELRAAEAGAVQARLSEAAVRRAVLGEVDELLVRLEDSQRRLAESSAEIKALARELEIATVQLGSGESDRTEPLTAKLRLLDGQKARVLKLMEYWALETGFRQAAGRAGV